MSLLTDLSTKCELQAMDILALRKQVRGLEDENAELRELLAGAYKDLDAWQRVIASSNQWGYGKGCLERLWELQEAMKELGMEVGLDECE